MSYPRDLDDYSDGELNIELQRRGSTRARGLCDYCHRGPLTPPCRYPDRHWLANPKAPALGPGERTDEQSGEKR